MNMKKMKKFFTLSRCAEGFTLVELIVVIAILAILGGVALPAYSGYIKKAHMAADQTMVSDVMKALQLQYYNDPNNAVTTYVVITSEGAYAMGEEGAPTLSAEATPTNDALALDFADKAMTAVFGANWRDTVVMEYDEWAKANYLPTKADAEAVAASSYYQKNSPAELISSFTDLTGALAGMANTAGQDPLTTMASIPNFMSSDEISAMRNQLDDLDVSWDKDKEAYTTAVSNLLVQNAATEISNLQPGGTMSAVSQMAANYALIYGWGSSTEEGAAVLAELNATLTNPNTNSGQAVEAVRSAYDQFMVNGGTYLEGGQGTADGAALQVIMGTVSDWSADADMTTAGLYSSDSIADAVNNYMAAVDAMDSMGENAPELVNALNKAGCIVVFIASNGKTGCNISIS